MLWADAEHIREPLLRPGQIAYALLEIVAHKQLIAQDWPLVNKNASYPQTAIDHRSIFGYLHNQKPMAPPRSPPPSWT